MAWSVFIQDGLIQLIILLVETNEDHFLERVGICFQKFIRSMQGNLRGFVFWKVIDASAAIPDRTASPTLQPPCRLRMSWHSLRMASPPARWMAPSTPPPPRREVLAALTMASTLSFVMSPISTDPPASSADILDYDTWTYPQKPCQRLWDFRSVPQYD